MSFDCIRCGDDVPVMPTMNICWECNCTVCVNCKVSDDFMGKPSDIIKINCGGCDEAIALVEKRKRDSNYPALYKSIIFKCEVCGSSDGKTPMIMSNGKVCRHQDGVDNIRECNEAQ